MERSSEIEAVNGRFWKSFIDRDRKAMASLSSRNPDLRLVLSADVEWIKGNGHIEDIMIRRAEEIGIVGVEFDRLEGFVHGDVGWSAGTLVVHRETGEDVSFARRLST